jgi:small-conductance mechanosensitive channel
VTFAVAAFAVASTAFAADAPAGEPTPVKESTVKVHERPAFALRADRAGQSAADRARAASQALDGVVETGDPSDARVEQSGGVAVVFVGKTPIVTLGDADALAAGETLDVFAQTVAARTQTAVRAEEKRSSIASTVFSVSLLVFSGLLAFLLFRRFGELGQRARAWVRANPDRVPALHLGRIEVVRPNAVRGGVSIALGVGTLVAQLAVGYGWLLFALSRFDGTRDYTERLSGFVLTPLWGLIARVGSALPLVVVAAVAALAVGVLVRFVSLFFESVGEGSSQVAWLPRELAAPTSVLARAGVIVLSLLLAAPLLTGADDGMLSRVGVAVLFAVGLACTPVVACVAAGIPTVFGRRLSVGDFVEIGGAFGRVKRVSLLGIELEAADGAEVRVPHLLALVKPTRVVGSVPPVVVEVTIDAHEPQGKVRARLLAIAEPFTTRTKVELLSLDGDGARYRLSGCSIEGAGDLASTVADVLRGENVALGRSRAGERT